MFFCEFYVTSVLVTMMNKMIIRIISAFLLVLILSAFIILIGYYKKIFTSNVQLTAGEETFIEIPTGSDYEDVIMLLDQQQILKNVESFRWVAVKKNYPNHVYPGRYKIINRWSNNRLVNLLRSGTQEPVNVVFNNIRSLGMLGSVISHQIEADSAELVGLLHDRNFVSEQGFTPETIMGVFIPNTYEVYWNTSAEQFIGRMIREYQKFWNAERLAKAEMIGLEPMEVITLASVIDEETIWEDEEPQIAGVYINRLKKGMRLRADPTIKFALGDMNIQRILHLHLEIDSPYNTYQHPGLPPGPIVIPSISAIDAVLNYEQHDYLYFCAKDDFSGYHLFAKTLAQHNKNARLYQKALNQRKILN